MKTLATVLGTIFGLALLAVFLMGAYFLFSYIVDLFEMLEPKIKAITAIISIVALLCAVIIARGLKAHCHKVDGLKTVEKLNAYRQLLALCSEQLKREAGGEEPVQDSEPINLEQLVALQGSPKVIAAYMELQRQARREGNQGDQILALLSNLVTSMREDLGVTASNLKESDISGLLLGSLF